MVGNAKLIGDLRAAAKEMAAAYVEGRGFGDEKQQRIPRILFAVIARTWPPIASRRRGFSAATTDVERRCRNT
jgi:hypothetical protein